MSAAMQDSAPNSPVAAKKRKMDFEGQIYAPAEFLRTLLNTPAEDFCIEGQPKDLPIFICKRSDLVTDVWNGLISHNFLSVPVLLQDGKSYFGIFDLGQIVRYMTSTMGDALKETKDYRQLMKEHADFKTKTISELMKWPLCRSNPFHPVQKGCSALMVVELLAKMEGLQRVPIVAKDRQMFNFVTCSQVVRFLNRHKDELGDKKDRIISSCKQFFTPNIISVSERDQGIDAFLKMTEAGISGVAVTHENSNKLAGHLSLRDLKLIGNDALLFNRLGNQVKNCIRHIRAEYQSKHNRPRTMVVAYPTDTIGDVITKIAESGVHHLFLVEAPKNKELVGVISLKNLFAEILA